MCTPYAFVPIVDPGGTYAGSYNTSVEAGIDSEVVLEGWMVFGA